MNATNANQLINKPIILVDDEVFVPKKYYSDDSDDYSDDDSDDVSVEDLNIDDEIDLDVSDDVLNIDEDELDELIREEEETYIDDLETYSLYAIFDKDLYDIGEEITFDKIRKYYWDYGDDDFSMNICSFDGEETVESVKELFELKKEHWEDYKEAVREQTSHFVDSSDGILLN